MQMKLGSLFDGSGGFPLAGALYGIEPVWASEIEDFPIRVTTNRFPNMKHLGDVSNINGAEIEPVDIITFGSPCQDLSIAGKQAGIHEGERSNLFFQAVRIIKEMRNATANKFPRYTLWENVPGAFSSNGGKDFQAVLQSLCSIVDEGVSVPGPADGVWKPAGCVLGDGYSFAWRILNAQYFGVAQRRRRVFLIGDLAGGRAGEILFECEGMQWHPPTGREAWENASAYVAGRPDGSGWLRWCGD
jgi:DNA (cytosine-5)-methyltransferase 1